METPSLAQALNRQSLSEIRSRFISLKAPSMKDALGRYQVHNVGPFWLRVSGKPSLALTGFAGFWGKAFLADNKAINLFMEKGKIVTRFPARLNMAASKIDGQPAIAMTYGAGTPWPWVRATDEFRALDDDHLLGLVIIDLPLFKTLPFPFLLQRTDKG